MTKEQESTGIDVEQVENVIAIEVEMEELNIKMQEEQRKIIEKYNAMKLPILKKRDIAATKIKGFWSTALLNFPMFSDMLQDKEVELMNFLTELRVERDPQQNNGFKLLFKFDNKENVFFSDSELIKTVRFNEDLGDYETGSVSASQWKKEGKTAFDEKQSTKQQANKRRKTESGSTDVDAELDEFDEEMEDVGFFDFLKSDQDFSVAIAQALADEFYPSAAQYYAGDIEDDDEESLEDDEE